MRTLPLIFPRSYKPTRSQRVAACSGLKASKASALVCRFCLQIVEHVNSCKHPPLSLSLPPSIVYLTCMVLTLGTES